MEPICRSRGNVGGGGFPPPVLSRCPGHACAENSLSSPSSSPPATYTPRLGITAVPLRLGNTSNMSEALHLGAESTTDCSLPSPHHTAFVDAPLDTLQQYLNHSTNTEL